MPEKQTFTYYLTIEVEAISDESALNKLSNWVEPTLALKKNADLECTSIEYDDEAEGAKEEADDEPEVKASPKKSKKERPAIKMPEKDDFDYDNIPDWDELEDDDSEDDDSDDSDDDEDDLDKMLSGLEDDEDDDEDDEDDEDDDSDSDDDWDWDDDDEEW